MGNPFGRTVVVPLTNQSGGPVAAGDVVYIDTAHDGSFTTGTTAGYTGGIGIAQAAIGTGSTGPVLVSGYAALVNVASSVTRGNYGAAHSVAKQAADVGVARGAGTCMMFLKGGTSPDATVWQPDLGAGSGTTDYVSGTAGTGHITIPGLLASPDRVPASPSAYDDEFTTLAGWTVIGTLGTENVTDFPSHLHLVKASAGLQIHGVYKAAPATPFTVTCKIAAVMDNGNYSSYGLALGDGTPTAWDTVSLSKYPSAWTIQRDVWSSYTSRSSSSNGSGAGTSVGPVRYLRLVVASTTSVTAWMSPDGMLWTPSGLGTYNPGFASKVGFVVSANGVQAECLVDWIRFS